MQDRGNRIKMGRLDEVVVSWRGESEEGKKNGRKKKKKWGKMIFALRLFRDFSSFRQFLFKTKSTTSRILFSFLRMFF